MPRQRIQGMTTSGNPDVWSLCIFLSAGSLLVWQPSSIILYLAQVHKEVWIKGAHVAKSQSIEAMQGITQLQLCTTRTETQCLDSVCYLSLFSLCVLCCLNWDYIKFWESLWDCPCLCLFQSTGMSSFAWVSPSFPGCLWALRSRSPQIYCRLIHTVIREVKRCNK